MIVSKHFIRYNRIILTKSQNPYLNLAKELDLLYSPNSNEKILYLWRNDPVVVIGKHQNPYKECNLSFMKEKNILLARRPTGGGAVYQDLGNTCWTFIAPSFTPKENTQVIVDTLKKLGVTAYGTGRNDIEVDGKKVSGAAFRKIPHRSIHHGTMLMNVDMKTLACSLTVDESKLKAKGVESVRSRVVNLKEISPEINHDSFCEAMIETYQNIHGKCKIEFTDYEKMFSETDVQIKFKQLSSHHWLYGRSSNREVNFSNRFEFGLFDVILTVKEGDVPQCIVHSDCLVNEVVEKFEDYLNDLVESKGNDSFFLGAFIQGLNSNESKKMAVQLTKWIKPLIVKWL